MKTSLDQWRSALFEQGTMTVSEVEELERHLEDSMEDIEHLPLSEEERFVVAANRIGHPVELGQAYGKLPGRPLQSALQYCVLGALVYSGLGALTGAVASAADFMIGLRFPRKDGHGLRGSARTDQANVQEETDLHRGVPAGCRGAIEGQREAA